MRRAVHVGLQTGLLGVTDTKDAAVPRRIDTLKGVQLAQVAMGLGGVAGAVTRTHTFLPGVRCGLIWFYRGW